MNIAITLLVLVNTAVSITLLLLWLRSHRQTQALQLEAAALATTATPANLSNLSMEHKKRIITVEILNPTDLAVAKSKFAKPLIRLAPDTIDKMVYKEARDILAKQLPTFGVNAEVKVHVV